MPDEKKKKKKADLEEIDDGETIADMNVDGMPWYVRRKYKGDEPSGGDPKGEPLTKEQLRAYKWAAIKAGLLVILVFGLVFSLFIAFCDFVWFK